MPRARHGHFSSIAVHRIGFPQTVSFAPRNQLPVFAALGFLAIAPDMRGYGRSSVYQRHEDYALEQTVIDMIELLNALGRERAVWVGHDWGSPVGLEFWRATTQNALVSPISACPTLRGDEAACRAARLVRRTDHPAPHWTQPTRNRGGIGQIRDAQCDIDAAGNNQIHHPVIELKLHNDLGMRSQKVWQCRCHMAQAKRHARPAHPAVWNRRRSVGFGLYCLALGEDAGRAHRQDAPSLCQRKRRDVRWISRSPSRASSCR